MSLRTTAHHVMAGSLRYSVTIFLKRQCDRTLRPGGDPSRNRALALRAQGRRAAAPGRLDLHRPRGHGQPRDAAVLGGGQVAPDVQVLVHASAPGLRIGLAPTYGAIQSRAGHRQFLCFSIQRSPIERDFGAGFLRASPVPTAGLHEPESPSWQHDPSVPVATSPRRQSHSRPAPYISSVVLDGEYKGAREVGCTSPPGARHRRPRAGRHSPRRKPGRCAPRSGGGTRASTRRAWRQGGWMWRRSARRWLRRRARGTGRVGWAPRTPSAPAGTTRPPPAAEVVSTRPCVFSIEHH